MLSKERILKEKNIWNKIITGIIRRDIGLNML